MPAYQFMNGVNNVPWLDQLPSKDIEIDNHHLHEFFRIFFERQEIWYKRNILKQAPPWTDDPFLRDYKFTNAYRELDRASQFVIKNVMLDHELSLVDMLWKLIMFRFYNQPSTFTGESTKIKAKVNLVNWNDFDPEKTWVETVKVREAGANPWHTAYLMNLAFKKKPKGWEKYGRGLFKDEAYVKTAFPEIHKDIPELASILKNADKPEEITHFMERWPAVSTFQSHEFYIDFCYAAKYWKQPIMKFDQDDYTNVGPGCSLGLRLVLPAFEPKEQKKGIYFLRDISEDYLKKFGDFKYIEWDKKNQKYRTVDKWNLNLHNMEFYLCEYSKYWKMVNNIGKQRSKYKWR